MIIDAQEIIRATGIKHKTFYDLGSGTGRVCFAIAKALPELKVIGVEIFRPVYILSQLKNYYYQLDNMTFLNSDFFSVDIKDADFIFLFLTQSFLDKLEHKIQQEAKMGCIIFSNNFPIHGLTLHKKITYADIITKRYLYIYQI
jgi:hypothetical protein